MKRDEQDPPAGGRGIFASLKSAVGGGQHDYTQGSLRRAVWLLAVPMVLELAMESVFAVCDIFFVSKIGDDAVAAVGVTEAMLTIVYALAIGLAMSATALVARRIGEKNVDGAVRAATAAIAVGIAGGLLLGVPGYLYAEELLALMDAPESVVAIGAGYARLILGLNVVVLLIHLLNGILRGAGDASLAMRSLWIANAINLVLDPCLIFGLGPFPELGMTGAAVATCIGRGTGVLFQFGVLRAGWGRLRLVGPAVKLRLHLVKEILSLSMGTIGQLLIATSSWVVLMRIVAPFGDTALAGYTIAIRIVMFVFLPAWGLANAAATLVGQNLGAGRPERAEQAVWTTGRYNMAFLGSVSVLFWVLAPALIGIFTEDAATRETGVAALRTFSVGYVFFAWGMVIVQAFNGAGDTMTPTKINFLCYWLIQIPLAWLMARPLGLGPPGLFWAVCIAQSILAAVAVLWFRRGKWKEVRLSTDA